MLDNLARVAFVQQSQLQEIQNTMGQVSSIVDKIENECSELDLMLNQLDSQLLSINVEEINLEFKRYKKINYLEDIVVDDDTKWDEFLTNIEHYLEKKHINLNHNPFNHLMTRTQQIELVKKIQDNFAFQKCSCDIHDYMISAMCGILGGLIDVLFVDFKNIDGKMSSNCLGEFSDNLANKITEKFASFCGWDRKKAEAKGSNTTKSAISFLETHFKINYDQATTKDALGKVPHLLPKNHHLKSIGHSPDIFGLLVSIINQFTNTSTFVNQGKIIVIDTEKSCLHGTNVLAKIFCGFANWFGHLISDWSGSSGAKGRGSGIPLPFYNFFQLCNFGHFGEKEQETFAVISSKVFENGYDLRHGIAMSIPVVVTELLARFFFVMKMRFYHGREWQDCLPTENNPYLQRMLFVSYGAFCAVDGTSAFTKSGSNLVSFLLQSNLIAWKKFAYLAIKELYSFCKDGEIDIELLDGYIKQEMFQLKR